MDLKNKTRDFPFVLLPFILKNSYSSDVLEVLDYVETVSTVAIHIQTEGNFQPRMIHYCPLIFVPLPNMAATIYIYVNYSLFE